MATTLKLDPKVITDLNARVSAFSSGLSGAESAKAAYRGAIQTQATAENNFEAYVRSLVSEIQVNSAMTNTMRGDLGITVKSSSTTKAVPVTVTGLIATGFANGSVKLKWNRNGNVARIVFLIEASFDGTTWNQVNAGNATKVTLTGFAAGTPVWFRVVSSTSTRKSAPTTAVNLYGSSESVSLKLAA
ncbi:MAG: fibronectin type III domain-containing protein [Armatimonadetes bacterium]|nr:fibronectin type III domain-containing protein [Armatimonadota bacterium]